MILEFTGLVIKNFGSFLGEHELDLASFGTGLHFVRGDNKEEPRLSSNGVGKSTLWNALCWCLYGRTPDGRRNPDIEPRFGAKATTVIVDVSIDGKLHHVTRTTHPNKLLMDNKEVGQEQIDQFIGLTFEVATHTLILGQGRPLFFDLKPEPKMKLLGDVLNLDRWDARAEYASEQTRALQNKESGLLGELNSMETQQDQLKTLLATAQDNWVNWRDDQEREAKTSKETLVKLKAQCEKVEVEKAEYNLAHDGAATELRALQAETRKLVAAGEKLVLDRSPFTSQAAIQKEKARSLRAELDALGEAEECPTCGQSLKGTNLSKHKAELKQKLVEASKKLKAAEVARDELIAKWETLRNNLNTARKSEQQFQDKVDANSDALHRIAPKLAELNAKIAQLETNAKKKQVEANPYTDQVTELKTQAKNLKADYATLATRLERLSEQIERTKFWVKGFKEVRLYIIEDILQELELATNATLAEVGLVGWQVEYSVEKETKSGTVQRGLNVMIQSPRDKVPVKWECWSGGEGQRLRLVGALALSEVLLTRAGVDAKIEILDEPTRGLSPGGIIDLCEFLSDRAKQLESSIFYCDHQSVESVRFTSVLTVVKTAKGSELSI